MASVREFRKRLVMIPGFVLALAIHGHAQTSDSGIESEGIDTESSVELEMLEDELRDEFEQWREEHRSDSGSSYQPPRGWEEYSYRNGSRIRFEPDGSSSPAETSQSKFGGRDDDNPPLSARSGSIDYWISDVDAVSERSGERTGNRVFGGGSSTAEEFGLYRSSASGEGSDWMRERFVSDFDPFDFSDPDPEPASGPSSASATNIFERESSGSSGGDSSPWGTRPAATQSRPFDARDTEETRPRPVTRAPAYLDD